MGGFLSFFKKQEPQTPVKGCRQRLKNIIRYHSRGILGFLVPLIIVQLLFDKTKPEVLVTCIWYCMFSTMLLQPIALAACGLLPLFLLPMFGIVNTVTVAPHYFNDSICLHILGAVLIQFVTISLPAVERRLILWFLCSGDTCQFSGQKMIFKVSAAAFFTSLFENRLVVTSTVTQFLTTALTNLQSSTSSKRKTEADYDEMRYIILCAVQTASNIGSITILHAALTPITMKAIWSTDYGDRKEYPDIFNYLQYTCFAFPVAVTMLICTSLYYMFLMSIFVRKPMAVTSMSEIKNFLLSQKDSNKPKLTRYMKQSLFAYCLFLFLCFFRWTEWFKGWSLFRTVGEEVPMIKDCTIAAAILIFLSMLPTNVHVRKYIHAVKKSEWGVVKPESVILRWRFFEKNLYYGYIILIGGGIALNAAVRYSGLCIYITKQHGNFLTKQPWNLSILMVCLIAVGLANIISGIGACCLFLPFVLNMALPGVSNDWDKRVYLGALGVGIGTSMGFSLPFLHTPAYFCHHAGKVPISKMIKYGFGASIVCAIVLALALSFYAPFIWDPGFEGIKAVVVATPPTSKKL